MEQPVENINVENVNIVPQNQQVYTYKEPMRMILGMARGHYDETYPCLEKLIEECRKKSGWKLRISIMHRHFFGKISQNPENIQTHCSDRRNPFHLHAVDGIYIIIHIFWYSILTLIRIQITYYLLI